MKRSFLIAILLSFFQSAAQAQILPSFADLIEKLQPSVVNISTVKQPDDGENSDLQADALHVEDFLQKKNPQTVSLGSGFIFDHSGFIVTNNHVIENAEEITVTTADNRKFDATVVGKDTKTDIALIKISANENFPFLPMGNSDKLRVGDWVLAIGNPFGLGGSVSAGIVSAKSRDIESGPYDNFIQTDASINQGSSGGPLLNLNGEVVGVSTAIFSTSGGSMGIGFAMPINQIKFVIDQLQKNGKVDRGWVGLKIQPNSTDIAESVERKNADGIIVTSVTQGSPAARAKIEAGDIILSFDGYNIENAREFSRLVAETEIGKEVVVKLWKQQKEQNVTITIEKMPEEVSLPKKENAPQSVTDFNELGLKLEEITPEIIDTYQLEKDQQGLVVTAVQPASDAENKGLKKGVVITHFDKKPVFDLNDAETYIREAQAENNRPVLLLIEENKIPHYAAVKLEKHE